VAVSYLNLAMIKFISVAVVWLLGLHSELQIQLGHIKGNVCTTRVGGGGDLTVGIVLIAGFGKICKWGVSGTN
jgi:hypothetical protein